MFRRIYNKHNCRSSVLVKYVVHGEKKTSFTELLIVRNQFPSSVAFLPNFWTYGLVNWIATLTFSDIFLINVNLKRLLMNEGATIWLIINWAYQRDILYI